MEPKRYPLGATRGDPAKNCSFARTSGASANLQVCTPVSSGLYAGHNLTCTEKGRIGTGIAPVLSKAGRLWWACKRCACPGNTPQKVPIQLNPTLDRGLSMLNRKCYHASLPRSRRRWLLCLGLPAPCRRRRGLQTISCIATDF